LGNHIKKLTTDNFVILYYLLFYYLQFNLFALKTIKK